MAASPPSLQPPSARPVGVTTHKRQLESLLDALLAAHRDDALDHLLRRKPRLTRRLAQRLLGPVRAVGGDALPDDPSHGAAWRLLLRARLAALRPDGGSGLVVSEHAEWVERLPWRPLLAVMCHYGFEPVARFPQSYRARPDESPAEQLSGLWNVGTSTFYRHLDKGKRLLANVMLEAPAQGESGLARDTLLQQEVYAYLKLDDPAERVDWHARQARRALDTPDARAALWHWLHAGDVAGFIDALKRFRVELASDSRTDALRQRLARQPLHWQQRFDLELARAGLARVRGSDAEELQAYEEAMRLANAAQDALRLGIVYGALGKYNEPRDPDRAFACYQESADFLRQAGLGEDGAAADHEVRIEYVHTLLKLAWLYVLRNDPRSKGVLDLAEAQRARCDAPPESGAMLEQVWGEYWRRSGDLKRALEHKHRALHVYERLGDRQSILKTYGNLSLIYGDAKDFARAIDYSQRVLDMAARFQVEPETVAATHLNLGAACFWQGRYGAAIESYRRGLDVAQQARLHVLVGRAHYNLAEAHYKRFRALEQADDERLGDAHIAAALALQSGDDPADAESTRQLKAEILGPRDHEFVDRLLPGELAAHFDEMSEVQRHRAALALPLEPVDRVAAHLAIARAHLDIAIKERAAAVTLIDRNGLAERFALHLEQLQRGFASELNRDRKGAARWREGSADLMPTARAEALLQHLLREGSIGKSGYAQLCGTGLATASKHLGQLAVRGLLQQSGKGPSTRYRLPD
ncbi:MAG TPA: tetratricopeptide repeat protein [Rubrivivax sp.]